MKNKISISSRGVGKVNEKGEIEDYKLISYDFTSLYPGVMPDFTDQIKKELLRKERKEKLDKLNEVQNNNEKEI